MPPEFKATATRLLWSFQKASPVRLLVDASSDELPSSLSPDTAPRLDHVRCDLALRF